METIKFENLPDAVTRLDEKIDQVLALLSSPSKADEWFSVESLCAYLPGAPVRSTIYSLVSRKKIPFRKRGKRLVFLRSEIDRWLETGQQENLAK